MIEVLPALKEGREGGKDGGRKERRKEGRKEGEKEDLNLKQSHKKVRVCLFCTRDTE